MLLISADGKIYSLSTLDDECIELNNEDVKNCMFDSFSLDNEFTFDSFFKMIIQYPVLKTFFPIIDSYIDEYKSIENKKETNKIAVIMPIYTVMQNIITHQEDIQIFMLGEETYQLEEDITNMYLSDYINYKLNINTLSLLEHFKDDNTRDASYFDNIQEDIFDLFTFVKFVIKNITLHGFVEERNQHIQEVENHEKEEKYEIEQESIRLAKDIMRKISNGDK